MARPSRSTEARALDLLEQAMEQPSVERAAWIAAQDAPAAARKRALALLGGSADAALAFMTGGAPARAGDAALPARIGAYRITGLIGQGGMGAVYRGERATGDFEHAVAIKVIRPGALSRALIERFRRERQTLARLAHPAIARLFDGGETEAGDPYIVMELVDGRALDVWLADAAPSLATRLELFLAAASAVAFAHQNLVVHGDVTPANVLVDAEGQPKLIDFGIARPLSEADPDTPAGKARPRTGTPGYAAPERLAGGPATTLSDVYSLGRVLGHLGGEAIDPELSAVVRRATADAPGERYSTVEELRAEVIAYRRGFPVVAAGGGATYVLGKFVRRHRGPVSAAAGALALLIVAFAVASWSFVRADAARRIEAERFGQVRAIAHYMIFDLNERLAQVAGNTAARADIAAEAQRYLDRLLATPRASDDLKLETARGLIRLARVQGAPSEPNLGDGEAAVRNLQKAQDLLTTLPPGPARDIERVLAKAYQGLVLLRAEGRQGEAEPLIRAADAAVEAIPAAARDLRWSEARRVTRKARLELADVGNKRDDIPALADALAKDMAAWPAEMAPLRAFEEAFVGYYRALHASGSDLPRAVETHLDVERRLDRLLAPRPNDPTLLYLATWNAFDGFAAASQLGREDVSHRLIEKARTMGDRLVAVDERDRGAGRLALNIKEGLAQDLRDRDHFAEAVAVQREVVAGRRQQAADAPSARNVGSLGFSLAVQGVIGKNAGERALACASWRDAERVLSGLEAKGSITGFHKSFIPGLRRANDACAAGSPLARIPPLRD